MRNKLKLTFCDMWGYENYQFNPYDNYFNDLFSLNYEIEITDNNPDLLIYSVFGDSYKKHTCKKMFFTGENFSKDQLPDHYNNADLVLSHYDDSKKELLLPLWVIFVNWFDKVQPRPLPSNPTYLVTIDEALNRNKHFNENRNFCAFINNSYVADRVEIFHKLSEYKSVHSLGQLFNNVSGAIRGSEKDKIDALRNFKFTIAYENSYHSGYNTEKIIQPMEAGCIPIYSGGERVLRYFNPNAFVNATNLSSVEVLEIVKKIDKDRDLYESMVLANPFKLNAIFDDFAPQVMLNKILNKLNL